MCKRIRGHQLTITTGSSIPPRKRFHHGSLVPTPAPPAARPRFGEHFSLPHTPAVSGFRGFSIPSRSSSAPAVQIGDRPIILSSLTDASPSAPVVQGGSVVARSLFCSSPSAPAVQGGPVTSRYLSSIAYASGARSSTSSSSNNQVANLQTCQPRTRWDAPVICHSKRGSRGAALAAAADNTSKHNAMQELLGDVSAKSVGNTLDSRLTTWILFHNSWFNDNEDTNHIPPFPLTT